MIRCGHLLVTFGIGFEFIYSILEECHCENPSILVLQQLPMTHDEDVLKMHHQYVGRGMDYGIIFIFILFYSFTIYKVNTIAIHCCCNKPTDA